jgi:adenine-specific DNA-methyltransferase
MNHRTLVLIEDIGHNLRMETINISPSFQENVDFVLYEGDCLELLPEIPAGKARLIVTSPPYNLGKEYEQRLSLETYLEQQRRVITECARVLHPQGSLCWQVGNYVSNGEIIPLDIKLYPIFEELGLHLRNRIIWYFGHGLHASRRFSGRYEVILWFTKSDQYTFNLDAVRVPQKYPNKKHFKGPRRGELSGNPLGKNPSDVWEIPNVKSNHIEKTEHPCQFPVELIERLVLSMTDAGDWVLDPFMGVGTTAIAALMHNRKAIGAEILPKYIEITKERIRLAEIGKLKVRPMDRPVYDPGAPDVSKPPVEVHLGNSSYQPGLFDQEGYAVHDGDSSETREQ